MSVREQIKIAHALGAENDNLKPQASSNMGQHYGRPLPGTPILPYSSCPATPSQEDPVIRFREPTQAIGLMPIAWHRSTGGKSLKMKVMSLLMVLLGGPIPGIFGGRVGAAMFGGCNSFCVNEFLGG